MAAAVVRKLLMVVATGSGTGTGNGSSQTIAHGLGAAPQIVSVVPTESPGATVTGLYVDATNIYVTVTSGIDYNWFAMRV